MTSVTVLIFTWFYGQSIATSQQEFSSRETCDAARAALSTEASTVQGYLQGAAGNGAGPQFPFVSTVCVSK
jgi:hypothetical protein